MRRVSPRLYEGCAVCIIAALVCNDLPKKPISAGRGGTLDGRKETVCESDEGQEDWREEGTC